MGLDKLNLKERLKAELDKLGVKYSENVQVPVGGAPKGLAKLEKAEANPDPNGYAEVRRIVNLPIIKPLTDLEIDAFSRSVVDAKYYDEGFRLRREQAEALLSFDANGGVFGPLRVGVGKSLICIGIADRAFRAGVDKILLLIPSQVYEQFVRRDIPWARPRINLIVPIHGLGNKKDASQRLKITGSGYKGVYVMPYSLLSVKDTDEMLAQINPGLVISDETHNLKNRHSARTKRVMRLLERCAPKFCAFSGTITSKRIKDYSHLIKAALGNNCPLPLATSLADDWGLLLDSDANVPTGDELKMVFPLVEWAREKQSSGALERIPDADKPVGFMTDGIRRAYRLRMVSAPGVVATSQDDLGVSLVIANRPAATAGLADYDQITQMLKALDPKTGTWKTPNGDEVDYAIHLFKWRYEISSGFYNKLTWPDAFNYSVRKGISRQTADDALKISREHHGAQQEYHKKLREFLQYESSQGLDTPFLVGSDMLRNGATNVPEKLYKPWQVMKTFETAAKLAGHGLVERDSEAVRVCDYKIRHLVQWAKALPPDRGALVWVWHQEMGFWAWAELQNAGIDAVHCPAGDSHNRKLLEPGIEKKVVVVSMAAHATGKNLQAFQENFFLQWPRDATLAEQAIGRTHRPGQEADELVMHTCNTTDFDNQNYYACLVDAMYVSQTNEAQKIVYAGYDPLPKTYPSGFLAERGFQNRVLSKKMEGEMAEKFGGEA